MPTNTLDQWKNWLKQKAEAEKALQQIDLSPAEEAIRRANNGLRNAVNQAPIFRDINVNPEQPTGEQVTALKDRLAQLIAHHKTNPNYRQQCNEWQTGLSGIEQAEAALAEVEQEHDALTADKAAIEAELEQLDKQEPKATKKGLEAVEAELERLEGERQRVKESLLTLADSAEAEQNRLQVAIDRLEAEKALGNGDAAALKKARQEAEAAKQEADNRASALRGMQSMESDLTDQIDSLENVLAGIAVQFHLDELEAAEGALVKALQGVEWDALLNNINAARDGLNAHSGPGVVYGRARLKIDMPNLYQIKNALPVEFPG